MKGLKQSSIALLVAGLLSAPVVQADNSAMVFNDNKTYALIGPAATALVGETDTVVGVDGGEWNPVLHTELSNAGTPKDLIMGLSFETKLVTTTEAKSRGGEKNTSTADVRIDMRIVVDEDASNPYPDSGYLADPGEVIFDQRRQVLWAQFAGLDCTADLGTEDVAGTGIVTCEEDEVVGLTLDTTSSHTFNFLASNIGSGSHTITAYARLSADGDYVGDGDKNNALLGKGTLSVWEVHGAVAK